MMKTIIKSFWLFLLVSLWSVSTQAQWPMEDGFAVMTCFSGYNNNNPNDGVANDFVMGVYDVRDYGNNPPNQNWAAPDFHDPSWTAGNLGQVFGVAIDETNGDIFVTATTCYPHNDFTDPLSFGPAGSGGVYRIDGTTAAITNIASLPNTGSGLGNITYDKENDQLFVTNHEDGLIYRLSTGGTVLSTWDFPGSSTFPGSGGAGFVELGERLWGIAVNDNKVYFGVWNEDQGRSSGNVANEIWSIDLISGNFNSMSAPTLELVMPAYESNTWSNPVSDISFDCHGYMLVAERGMGDNISPSAHNARVLEFKHNGTAWVQFNQYKFGANSSTFLNGDNSAGGVDYGFGGYDPQTGDLPFCDTVRWVTGDFFVVNGQALYGGGGMEEANSDVWYVDADGVFGSNVKRFIGDIEIMGVCSCCDTLCDSCDLNFEISYCCQSQGIGGDPSKCDVCDTTDNPNGNFWVWIEDPSGSILWSPPYIIEWTDENGNFISNAPALLADVNMTYCVTVIDPSTPDSCVWDTCFEHLCCDSIEVEITGCFSDSIDSYTFDQDFLRTVRRYEKKIKETNLLDTTSCDPCLNPNDDFLLWVVDGDGNILDDPPYTFEWTDENGTVLSDFPVVIGYVNTWYYVEVTDSIGCVFVDSFYYECCEELEVDITSCYDFIGRSKSATGSIISPSLADAMETYKSKHGVLAAIPAEGCDPCEYPEDPIFVWATDGAGNELTDPPYTFTWKDDQGNVISTFPFAVIYVNQKYYLCVEDTLGCMHVDSIEIICCEPVEPTNLSCFTFGLQTFLTWDPVPGATTYEVIITPYLSIPDRCCPRIPQFPQSHIYTVTTNEFNVANAPYRCFHWSVRAVCSDGTSSPSTRWQCFNGECPIIGRYGQGGSHENNIIGHETIPIEMLKAFPNPTSGKLQLTGPAVQPGWRVEIYDHMSRQVDVHLFQEDGNSAIDLSDFATGVYYLQAKDPTGTSIYTTKVMVVK